MIILGSSGPARAAEDEDAERARWTELAARCGEELAWARDWEDAAARASAEEKPVLAVAWLYAGFTIADATRTVFAMDPDVIEIVNARFVPLRLAHDTEVPFASQESYGLSETAFGAALLVVTPRGEVLADTPHWQPVAAYDFLQRTLAEHPGFPGAKQPKGLDGEERAAWHLARGELDEAEKCLSDPRSTRGFFLRARLLRRRHETEAALAALESARERQRAPGDLAAELDGEQIALELGRGHVGTARSLCERLVQADPAREEALSAAHVLGVLDFFAGDRAAAERRWRALVADHAGSRWAAEAAAALLEPETQLGDFTLERSSPELLATLRDVPPAPLVERKPEAALEAGLEWLATKRRADGGWPDPSEIEGTAGAENSISVAVDVLAARALLAHRDRRGLDVGHEAELALRLARASLAARGDEPTYMTYEVWSDALALELVVDLLEAGAKPAAELRALGRDLALGLAARQRSNGGWSYFEAASLEAGAVKPVQSISFVTATVVQALLRALEAEIEIDVEMMERGLDALEAMRSDSGVFAYMLWSYQKRAPEEDAAGAAGRAPLCELALLRAGRSDEGRLRAALDQFFEHSAMLAKETGKALMHCGTEGQGCHYILYDYATAARAVAALPASERKPYRARLLALLDSTRRADGAFLDTPVMGPASGTALALLALSDLGEK